MKLTDFSRSFISRMARGRLQNTVANKNEGYQNEINKTA